MIKVKKINDSVVRVPNFSPIANIPALGRDLFEEPFCNVFLSAKKKSGKTWAIFHILKKCLGKDTRLILFCSTLYKDDAWKYITNYFEERGHVIEGNTSLSEMITDETSGRTIKVDKLKELLHELEQEAEIQALEAQEDIKDVKEEPNPHMILYDAVLKANMPDPVEDDNKMPKKRKSKYLAPDLIIVLDDLSTELKSTSLVGLLKKNRHYRMKVIISSQWIHDLLPESRKQIDYFLLFGKHTRKKLEIIYKDADLSISLKTFLKLYRHATQEPYSFLYIDTVKEEFRKKFNQQYTLIDSTYIKPRPKKYH